MIGSTTCCPIDGLLRTLKRNWTIVWKKNGARQRLQKPVAMRAVSPIAISEIHRADALPRNSKRYVGAERFLMSRLVRRTRGIDVEGTNAPPF